MAKKKTDEKEIRKAFREMRQWSGLSQIELAKRTGLSSDKLARWEKGQAKFNDQEISRLGSALDAAAIARAETAKGPLAGSGAEVKSLRKAYGITQEELARRTGMTQAAISLFENGYNPKKEKDSILSASMLAVLDKLVGERDPHVKRGVPLASLAQPVRRSPEEQLRKEVELLREALASRKKVETISEEIRANQNEIIEEYKSEIARLELLNKEISESKDREIQTLREQLEAKNTAVTVPSDRKARDSGEAEE
jgi:transcriptional regulator with XRE-family HTH domain